MKPMTLAEELNVFRQTHQAKRIDVSGAAWEYITAGSAGETILLMHGGTGSAESVFRYTTALEDDFRVITPTIPTPVSTVREALSGICAILSMEGVKTMHCFGLSMGGMLEQVYLREHPEQVQSLILFHCPPPSPSYGRVIERTMRANRVMPTWLSQLLRRYLMTNEMREYSEVPKEEKRFWSEYYRSMISQDRSFNQLSIVLDYLRNYRFAEDDLRAWPGRIMIIETATDSVIPQIERSHLKALYPQAKVHTYPTGGHLSNGLFKVVTTIALVKDFLRKKQ